MIQQSKKAMMKLEEYHKLIKEHEQQLIGRDEGLEMANDINSNEEKQQFAGLGVYQCEERIRAIEAKTMEDVHGN